MPAQRNNNGGAFRFQGRRALLTYSRVGAFDAAYALAEALIPHIMPLANDNFQWKWAVEQHHDEGIEEGDLENGSWHVHVAIDLGKSCTERGQIFDFQGHHPNLKPCGGKVQWHNVLKDLEKNNCWQTNIDDEMDEEDDSEPKDEVFRKALAMGTEEEFQETIAEGDPEAFCKSYISIRACGQDRFRREPKKWTARRTLADFANVPQVLTDYATYINSDDEIERPKALIIISPTRFGKTQWARTINANHGYMATEWNVDKIQEDCKIMIFDDVPMSELLPRQRWKAFFGMQEEFDVSGKYRGS